MKYLVSASEMRRYDDNTTEKIGIPACVLMERAALAAVEAAEAYCAGLKGRRSALIMARPDFYPKRDIWWKYGARESVKKHPGNGSGNGRSWIIIRWNFRSVPQCPGIRY